MNLLTTDEGSLMDYINKPIGGGRAPSRQLKPLIAVPTTAGTGWESTAMCVLDVLSMRVKTGISHWRLRPTLAVIDPLVSLTLPPEVTAAAGMDIVCHALESYTARWYTTFDRKQPEQRAHLLRLQPGLRPVVREGASSCSPPRSGRRSGRVPTSRRAAT